MTLIVTWFCPSWMVLAADSRTTMTIHQELQWPTWKVHTQVARILSDSTEKVFCFKERFWIATCGEAFVDNTPISFHIQQIEEQSWKHIKTTESLAKAVLEYFKKIAPKSKIGFSIIWYDDGKQWVLNISIENEKIERMNLDTKKSPQYAISYMWDFAIIRRLLDNQTLMPLSRLWVQDTIDLTRHLIQTTISQMRFEMPVPTVWWPIDTLVITPSGAKWVAKKVLSTVD